MIIDCDYLLPALFLLFFLGLPSLFRALAGSLREALAARFLRGTLPPTVLRAVCLVRAILFDMCSGGGGGGGGGGGSGGGNGGSGGAG